MSKAIANATEKSKTEDFTRGDYVRILTGGYSKYAKDLYYKNNIFEIERIEGDQLFFDDNSTMIKLKDIEELVPFGSIEAIPLDGKHDQNIYYDPIIAASSVLPEEPIPVHNKNIKRKDKVCKI